LTWTEDHSIAERQAALLLDLWGISEPPVPQFVISSLPGLLVEWRKDWPISGLSVQTPTHWQIVISAEEPRWRQRFSLAHELKHVIDDPVIQRKHRHLAPDKRDQRAERMCDWFAACLLMPRPWVKHDYCGGLQNPYRLAQRYYVSTEAMTTRLTELGLVPMTLALEPGSRRHAEAS
jgi:Zn-dependent peptidase ImmA (M78 family)